MLLIIGDNLNDFTTGSRGTPEERRAVIERHRLYWGSKWFMLPNPLYGGWVSATLGEDDPPE